MSEPLALAGKPLSHSEPRVPNVTGWPATPGGGAPGAASWQQRNTGERTGRPTTSPWGLPPETPALTHSSLAAEEAPPLQALQGQSPVCRELPSPWHFCEVPGSTSLP